MILSLSGNPFEWDRPDDIRTQLTYRCSVKHCGDRIIKEYLGITPDIPKHPGPGWRMIGDGWICPRHSVTITIDGFPTEYK